MGIDKIALAALKKAQNNETNKEDASNKLTAFQTTPDDVHYPGEKLVKDSLDSLDYRIWAIESGILPLGVLFEGMPSVVTGERTLNNTGRTLRVNSGSMNTDPYPETDIRFQFGLLKSQLILKWYDGLTNLIS